MLRTLLLSTIFLFNLSAHAQHTLSGSVMDSDGEPLPGATIVDVNSLLGTVSDANGAYRMMQLDEGEHVIQISYLGFYDLFDTLDIEGSVEQSYALERNPLSGQEFVVEATRVSGLTPMTHQDISKEEIDRTNLGQDMPIILNQTVSAVTTSDAGAGIGYTGIRIRGSDATRINVTVNGVPINDAESHGVFWVNMPDFASSTSNIQIQRGVGSSTNGASAFGASINLESSTLDTTGHLEFNNSYGSFNSRRHNLLFSSGLFAQNFAIDGRYSYIASDGYIDRSSARLQSYYLSGGYYGEKLTVKAITFAGEEQTQQAWYGTPQSVLEGDDNDRLDHALTNGYSEEQTTNLLTSGRTYNHYLYDNEIDNYGQDHYQLIVAYDFTKRLRLNLVGHYTYGRGYFEQYKADDDFSAYGLVDPVVGTDTILTSDFVIQRWLENHFYGAVYSLSYKKGGLKLVLGGAVNEYLGDHFGKVISSSHDLAVVYDSNYYFSHAQKQDFSNYAKMEYTKGKLTLYADVQYRYLQYQSSGTDNDLRPIQIKKHYNFINPKLGASYRFNHVHSLYASIARASREPVRGDFTDAGVGQNPSPEFMTDAELGYDLSKRRWRFSATAYFMHYVDQLVLTGALNDVGSPIRFNVPESYRAGLELLATINVSKKWSWSPNVTLSQNRILALTEQIYDYTNGFDIVSTDHKNTDISFSPSIIAGSILAYKGTGGLKVALLSKFVGKQYLDNTSNEDRIIKPYFVNDVSLSYAIKNPWIKALELSLLVNNILDAKYSSNGYTYSYIYGTAITENFYYPQAGTNWLVGLKVGF